MKNISAFFLLLFSFSFCTINAQLNQNGITTDSKQVTRPIRYILTINSIEKDGQLEAAKEFTWNLKNIKTEEDKKMVEKLKTVLNSYKPSFSNLQYETNQANFKVTFGMSIKATELEALVRSINIWVKTEQLAAPASTVQESKN